MDFKGLRVRPYQDKDFEQISKFYSGHGWPVPPQREILPDIGFIAESIETGEALAVGFLYTSNSNVFFLEWTATNPESSLRQRARAFKLVVKTAMALSKRDKPGAVIMQYTPNEAIIRAYKKLGFQETERATLLVWK
jgi:hypothetical protein